MLKKMWEHIGMLRGSTDKESGCRYGGFMGIK